MRFSGGPVRVGCPHPPVAVDGLVGGRGQDQQLVPLVGQQSRVDLHWNLSVEGQSPSPLDKFEHNSVTDTTQFVRQLGVAVIQQIGHILQTNVKIYKILQFYW